MMMSIESLVDDLSNKTYDELIKERDEIIRDIRRFEKNYINKSELGIYLSPDSVLDVCPSPDVVYQFNLEYLSKICELLLSKYQKDVMIVNP